MMKREQKNLPQKQKNPHDDKNFVKKEQGMTIQEKRELNKKTKLKKSIGKHINNKRLGSGVITKCDDTHS